MAHPPDSIQWPKIQPWNTQYFETPVDFLSHIGTGLVYGVIHHAFSRNPGIAVPAFVFALLCGSSLLYIPSELEEGPDQIINALSILPKTLVHAFMGKELELGLSHVTAKFLATFLQWKLSYLATEATIATTRLDFEWIKKLAEHPEEMTLGLSVFFALGSGIGLLPALPETLNVAQSVYAGSFLHAFTAYGEAIYINFARTFNAIKHESQEVMEHGASGAKGMELIFIGLKLSLLCVNLVTGTAESVIQPIQPDWKQLILGFSSIQNNGCVSIQNNPIIQTILNYCGIPAHTTLASEIQTIIKKTVLIM